MVRDFYLVIEKLVKNGKLDQAAKYERLRNALSRPGRLRKDTKNGLLNDFSQGYFDLTPNDECDHSSPKNRQHVRDEAIKLEKIALNHLKRIL